MCLTTGDSGEWEGGWGGHYIRRRLRWEEERGKRKGGGS